MFLNLLKQRYRLVFGYLGNLFVFFPIVLLIPLLYCIWYPEDFLQSLAFVEAASISFVIGMALKLTMKVRPGSPISVQEGAIVVLFSWVMAIILSALPFIFAGYFNFTQAVFESTSGWTTTGLTLTDVETIPGSFLLWRSMMQYLGGAGIAIIMMSAILGPAGLGLYKAEGRMDNLVPNIKSSTRTIAVIYGSYAIAGIIMYRIAGMNLFDAINHSLTALATGGFSTKARSIAEFNSVSVEIVTIVLMLLGATGFGIHYTIWKRNFRAFWKNGEPKLMFVILAIFTPLLMTGTLSIFYSSATEQFRHSVFQAVSALTGTGFSTVDFVPWNHFGIYLIILLMIFGGDLDSTSGGLKQYRLFALIKILWLEIRKYFLPKDAILKEEIWKGETKRYIDNSLVKEILLVFSLYFLTYAIGTGVLMAYGHSMAFSAFEYASALSTVGLSVGITAPNAPAGLIWAETIGMFLGRLEFLVVIYAITKLMRDGRILLRRRRNA
ncbi:potassium transporter [Mesotoga sp. HF07.pep.5.2.highcov]|jgi:trk system potassium uptake protein TrkH|uniref:TrkH family potassium uptake protein n=2 Tax=Mesotoga TaxID=1184396 RepID=UPI000C1857A8|nr:MULTISPECIES: TrkH family potassium uptake protein [unclassified Mesotoga]PIJ63393.1 potassium transporter [Mesotoga sp. H07.pep.5.3]RLL85804.1 potassium transporter [Mesotoga sp. H07pep.5.4]RLL92595.1 potassium transporter [Mesotoga sp. HF07.pep.5.2.highcov]